LFHREGFVFHNLSLPQAPGFRLRQCRATSNVLPRFLMTVEAVRQICLRFPCVTEDVKWGNDLVFSVGKKMFAALDIEPPNSLGFKCSPESFAELTEREGI